MDQRSEYDHYGNLDGARNKCATVSASGSNLEKAWEPAKEDLGIGKESTIEDGSTNSPASSEEDFPEGGRAAWLSLAGCFCAWMASFGLMNTVGTFQAYLQTHQLSAYSEAEVGWIFGLYLFMAYCCGVQAGPIFDAVGPRALTAAGSVCQVASMFLLGACSRESQKGFHDIRFG